MTPIDHVSPLIETSDNFHVAWDRYSEAKGKRGYIINFERNLDDNLRRLLKMYVDETWTPSPYKQVWIRDKKLRQISKAVVDDHVIEAATIIPCEQQIYDYVSDRCPAVKPKKGTTGYLRILRNDFYNHTQSELMYYIPLDVIHYFPTMSHDILKQKIRHKVKDKKLIRFCDRVIDAMPCGIPLGVKIAQLFGIAYLADFDRLAMRCFDIQKDIEKYNYWKRWYVTEKIATCRSAADAAVINRGVAYLGNLFDTYIKEGIPYYTRFVDNIIFRHRDKTFLRIMRDLSLVVLSRDYLCRIHTDYNIRPCYMGVRAGGFVIYHDHVLPNKINKTNLCKGIHYYLSHGYTPEETRIKMSSLIGFCNQSKNIKNLLIKNGMEKSLGKIIKSRHADIPWSDMTSKQKQLFSDVVYDKQLTTLDRECFKIMLLSYQIRDSKIETERVTVRIPDANGHPSNIQQMKPKKTLVIRYKKIVETYFYDGDEHYKFAKVKDKDGQPTDTDAEFYAFTGSTVLIDEALNEFSIEDLPCPTVIEAFTNKAGKKFYKFT
jgi:hypothetical protein